MPDDVWLAATLPDADTDGQLGRLGGRPHPRGHRGEPGRPRRPLRRLDERGSPARRRLGRAGGRAAARARPRLRAGRRGLVPLDRFRRRQGPGDLPLERRADLFRRRHRLRDREVQPRLRPPHLRLGRRPPRHGRPRPQRRRGDGLRPRGGPDPALLVGPLRARRRGSVDEQARPASSSRSTSCWPRSASTRRAGSSRHGRRRPASTSTSSWRRSSRPRTPSTTSSTRTPGSRRSCARPPAPGSRRRPTVTGSLAGAPEAALARAISRFPEVVEDAVRAEETQGITAYATELATTFHGFYRDARVVDPDEPERSAARLALADAARITLANALTLLGISAPESM